ncbi:Uncharacterized protein M6B38_208895 [Iris pallida]|uniref:UBZ4-type domain-containing protein n=1 Tax=Iris pallida TaxID=29817 RepID=A0AAX6E4Y5_IRIPA|nr:Uncharacterized protein M6B38_208895 [Iris pallida]
MLSTENQPDPPCSSRASDAADPNFSIRDYAFASRSRDRETSWPFPQELLQLCFKHGIKDPLPPFEPPDSVRSQCQRKADELEAGYVVVSEARYPSSRKEEEKEQIVVDEALAGEAETLSAVTKHTTEVELVRCTSLPEKNCKLVLKLGLISQTRRTEDVASASSAVSDPMASKVCPVCKLFSSPSNTTLNAHMDQCLSAESNDTELVATRSKNPRVRPRLKRLIVDIYAAAPRCTLEDLDSRNGTTWARDLASSVAVAGGGLPTETKRPRLSSVDFGHDGDEAVYVDSNGVKLRILSKSGDVPPGMPKDESKLTKDVAETEEGKGPPFSKNKKFGSKLLKHMKVKQMSRKLSSFDMPTRETEAQLAEDYHAEANKEKEETMLPVAARSNIESSGHATLGQWVCSKRSDLRKKTQKAISECSENQELTTKGPLLQSRRPDLSVPPVVHTRTNSSWSGEDFRFSPKTKRVDLLQTISNKKGSPIPHVTAKLPTGSSSTNSIRLKLSRSCQTSRGEEHTTARTLDSCRLSTKAKKIVSLKKNILVRSSLPLEEEKDDTGEIAPKMFRKRRSKLVTVKHGGELPTDVNGTGKRVSTHKFSFSSITSSRDQMSPRRSNLHESEKEREEVMPMEELNRSTEHEPLEGQGHDDDRISSDTLISEHLMTDSVTCMDPEPSGGKYVQSIGGGESHEEPTAPTLYDKNAIAGSTEVAVADAVEFRGEGDYSQVAQHGESDAETVSAQESSACLTSHGEVGLDVPLEINQTLASDRDPSFSPGSTASTISTLSRKVHRSKDLLEAEEVRRRYEREVQLRNQEVEMIISLAKEPEQLSDDQTCCCSRREGLSTELPFAWKSSMPGATAPSGGEQMSGLYTAPRQSSFVSYSSLRAPTGSTRLSGNGGLGSNSTFSPCQTPSTSNSVLRLMGKDLMVIKEEPARPTSAQTSPPVNPFPSLGFAPTCTVSGQESFWCSRGQLQTGSCAFGQASPASGHQYPLHQQRPFSSFPSHSHYIPRDVSSGFRPVYPKPCPRESASRVESTEGLHRPPLPSPFFFQSTSTGQLGRSVYYP